MAKYWNLECLMCKKQMKFTDIIDIRQAHWTILAWDVDSNTPRATCPKCVYPVNIIKKKYD